MNPFLRRTLRGAAGLFIPALILLYSSLGWPREAAPVPEKKTEPAASTLPAEWLKPLTWRSIGPANMGGRITALSVYEADPTTYWVATASGGLLKTVNNGITFEHQFDRESTVSIGDLCVAPSNKDIVWVGTGENNPRNSASYGDGVYKSTDGGKTWKNMGLKKSFQIGRIVVHPTNPNIVYVGALGRLWGGNEERGLFKTTDGGQNWDNILYIDDKTGVIDLRMDPSDPETLLVATWERRRDGFDSWPGEPIAEGYDGYDPIQKWGPGSGLYKTTDGGRNFQKLTHGLPTCPLGRIGIDYYRKEPNTVYAIIDCQKIGMGTPPKTPPAGGRRGGGGGPNAAYVGLQGEDAGNDKGARLREIVPDGPADKAGLKAGDVIAALGDKPVKTYGDLMTILGGARVGDKIKVQLTRGDDKKTVELTVAARPGGGFGPGGATATRPYRAYYGGQRENVQDQQGPNSFEYGGVYKSIDGGESWTRVNSFNPRPMYFSLIRVDPTDDANIYVGGISMYRSSDGGKTFQTAPRGIHSDQHALWIDPRDGRHMLIGCDGGYYVTYDRMANWDHLNHMAIGQFYHVALCSKRPYWVYGGLQDNGSWGGPSVGLRGGGPINEDWISVGGGDGYVCGVDPSDPDLVYYESQDGAMGRRNLLTGESARIRPRPVQGQPPYRFNWNTPFILSHHNPKIFYCGGNYVFRSLNKGDDLRIISPEITLTKRGSATALAESPRNQDVLWAGTDDGALWVTRNGGRDWTNVAAKVGLPGPRWVATIEASRFAEGRAYVAFDCHRSDDDAACAYVTEDFGQTWKSLRANLPAGSTRCLREDVQNPDLLYLGSEFAVFVSLDRGVSWTKLNNNLPTVAVHEIAVHPEAGEIVAATHGRSLWVLDVTALRQITPAVLKEAAHLYKPHTAVRWKQDPGRGGTNRRFVGENPPFGASLCYSLTKKPNKIALRVLDIDGTVVRELSAPTSPGLHKVVWDTRRAGRGGPGTGRAGAGTGRAGAGGRQGQGRFQAFGTAMPAGAYRVVLTVDGKEFAQSFRVEGDGGAPARFIADDDEDDGDGDGDDDK
jgi:photosystem II stability/assembly factor-like uncharacterized protein